MMDKPKNVTKKILNNCTKLGLFFLFFLVCLYNLFFSSKNKMTTHDILLGVSVYLTRPWLSKSQRINSLQ